MNLKAAKRALSYDPETGVFTWTIRAATNVYPGDEAGTVMENGYVMIALNGKKYSAHRLAWLWVRGAVPRIVDHIDGVRTNNRINNLRDGTRSVNQQNRKKASSRSKTGVLGVSEVKPGRFRAALSLKGRFIYLGVYDTAEEAHEAYLAGKRKLHIGNTL